MVYNGLMPKSKQPINRGVPALVFVKTDQKVIINGKTYTLLKMFYDTKGEYKPLAAPMY